MKSSEIIAIKKTIKEYVDKLPIPREVARMILKEVLDEVTHEALGEALSELEKGGKEDGGKPKETEE